MADVLELEEGGEFEIDEVGDGMYFSTSNMMYINRTSRLVIKLHFYPNFKMHFSKLQHIFAITFSFFSFSMNSICFRDH